MEYLKQKDFFFWRLGDFLLLLLVAFGRGLNKTNLKGHIMRISKSKKQKTKEERHSKAREGNLLKCQLGVGWNATEHEG